MRGPRSGGFRPSVISFQPGPRPCSGGSPRSTGKARGRGVLKGSRRGATLVRTSETIRSAVGPAFGVCTSLGGASAQSLDAPYSATGGRATVGRGAAGRRGVFAAAVRREARRPPLRVVGRAGARWLLFDCPLTPIPDRGGTELPTMGGNDSHGWPVSGDRFEVGTPLEALTQSTRLVERACLPLKDRTLPASAAMLS